ncbi:MAG: hypothetical protein FJZ01_22100 [Candidatus Sericytochromatia bacterium]|nr:hypothetical protein [Candidatus Tanganyikabacteria bacterium]
MRILGLDLAFMILFWILVGPPLAAVGWLAGRLPVPTWAHLGLAPLYALLFVVLLLAMAGIVRTALPALKPGSYPFPGHRQSGAWLAHFALMRVMSFPLWSRLVFAFSSLRWLWFRSLGARAAFDMRTAVDITVTDPSLVEVGQGSMLSAGTFLAGHFIENDHLLLAPVRVGKGAQLHGQVTLAPGAEVGEDAVVGPGTTLLPSASIGCDAHVGLGCLLHNGARVGDNAVVGHQAVLEADVVVGAGAVVQAGARVPRGTVIPDGGRFPPRE